MFLSLLPELSTSPGIIIGGYVTNAVMCNLHVPQAIPFSDRGEMFFDCIFFI